MSLELLTIDCLVPKRAGQTGKKDLTVTLDFDEGGEF